MKRPPFVEDVTLDEIQYLLKLKETTTPLESHLAWFGNPNYPEDDRIYIHHYIKTPYIITYLRYNETVVKAVINGDPQRAMEALVWLTACG